LDWGGLTVVWLLVLVVVWARLWVGGLVFIDDAVARRGAHWGRGVDWCRRRRRSRSWCWLDVACMSVVCVMLSVAAQGCLEIVSIVTSGCRLH
jgi:hypothetical protein